MKMFRISAAFVLSVLAACTRPTDKLPEASLLDLAVGELSPARTVSNLSNMFSDVRVVRLETGDSCLIGGRGNKIQKFKGTYYIQSFQTILCFSSDGRFLRRLDKVGEGPDEYPSLYDYRVLSRNGSDELWVSSAGGIWVYDAVSFAFHRKIPIEGFVNQFRYVNERTILVVAPEDDMLKVCNLQGKVRHRFWKRDPANSGQKFHPFFTTAGKTVYQVDDTQTGIVYDEAADSLYCQDILSRDGHLLTPEDNRAYYERYGYELQTEKTRATFVSLKTVRTLGDSSVLVFFMPDGDKRILLHKEGESKLYSYAAQGQLQNDVTGGSPAFLSTVFACESDDSFVFVLPSGDAGEGKEESNPWLLDVSL